MSTLFGGGKKDTPTQMAAPTVQDAGQGNAQRQMGRASLYLTSPQGILTPATTTNGKLLGN